MNILESHEIIKELDLLIRSKRPIIYLVSQEENRVVKAIDEICSQAEPSWDLLQWDIVSGLESSYPEFLPVKANERLLDQDEILNWFKELVVPKNKYAILVVKDFNKFFGSNSYKNQIGLSIPALVNIWINGCCNAL